MAADREFDDPVGKPADGSRPGKSAERPKLGRPEPRWPRVHRPGLRWIANIDDRIRSLDRPDQGTFMSLTNALEYQFEVGAVPSVLRHLLEALFEFARAVAVSPDDLGTTYDPGDVVEQIRPKSGRRPPPPR